MKTKPLFHSVFFVLQLVFMTNCGENAVGDSNVQEVLFEVNHVNSAWGKQLKGFIIRKDGTVRVYDNPAKWNKADKKEGLTVQQMKENLSNTIPSAVIISMQDINRYTSKIDSLTDSVFSKPVSGGADLGMTSFYAYRFDGGRQTYEPVLLGEVGDVESHNKDKFAVEISVWLTGILDRVY